MIREICVTHIGCTRHHRYRTDDFSDWLDAFEKDLHDGFFYAWRNCHDTVFGEKFI